jgi:hypothetical protein
MTVDDAQRDLGRAYVGGGPGVFISSLSWFAAALAERTQGVAAGFAVLFFSGMLIFPLATLACRYLFRRPAEAADNPLGRTALESTIAMLGGLFAAWLFLPLRPDYVFPLAAIAVGTHYAVFKTVYGDRTFWLLGAIVTGVGLLGVHRPELLPGGPVFAVALVELVFALLLTWGARNMG